MGSQETLENDVRLRAENIGGIERTNVDFEPGVTILAGRNATNRTSFLQAIMAGLGSTRVALKGDAEHGDVMLQIGDEEYTRTLERDGDSIHFSGDPYLDDPELADLFAFLLESNEARRSVARGDDLRDIMMRPVDADAIQAEIRQLKSERDEVEQRIQERRERQEKLPALEEKRNTLEDQIEDKRAELEEKRKHLNELSADAEQARAEQSELDEKMQTLQEKRSDLETTEFRLENQRESLDSLKDEAEQLEAEYEKLQDQETVELDQVDDEIRRLRERKQHLDSELSKLQNVIQFNEEMLNGTSTDIAAALRDNENENDTLTDQLLEEEDRIVCWTCGTEVEESTIEDTLERLRELRESKYGEQSDIEDQLEDLKEQKSAIESAEQKREHTKTELADVRAEIETREEKIDALEREREALEAEISELADEIETLEKQDRSEVLSVHREVNELELELERLEDQHDDVTERIEDIESQKQDIEHLEEQHDQITDQIEELRTRVDRIEKDAIEEFNDHMDTVLDILDYDNLDRIWVERIEREARQGRRKVTQSEFRLHVVRSTDDGVTYEDDFAHLSESEREVTGLVFALAGYLAHDVYEEVPFILLDSLEAIDSERIATLIEYFRDYADYLVTALLPEDASALDDTDYEQITTI